MTCFFLSFQTFYQAFEVHKKEACEKIEWLEQEVNKLEVQVLQGRKFDTALMTGSGRGRPKADGFVRHVRCRPVGYRLFIPVPWLANCLF